MAALVTPAMSKALQGAETDPMKPGCSSHYSHNQSKAMVRQQPPIYVNYIHF